MTRQDIRVLVIDRVVYSDELDHGDGLEQHARAFKAYGYSVTHVQNCGRVTPEMLLGVDIIVAHPPWNSARILQDYRVAHPEIPVVLDSGAVGGGRRSKHENFYIDANGTYYAFGADLRGYLKLLKHLTAERYRAAKRSRANCQIR